MKVKGDLSTGLHEKVKNNLLSEGEMVFYCPKPLRCRHIKNPQSHRVTEDLFISRRRIRERKFSAPHGIELQFNPVCLLCLLLPFT